MLLSSVLITGGTLYAGVKTYHHKKRKKTYWIDYVKKVEKRKKKKTLLTFDRKKKQYGIYSVQTAIQNFKEERIYPFFGDVRNQQLKEISATSGETSDAEKTINQYLAISSISMTLSTAGLLFYPPLALLGMPGVLWVGIPAFQDAYQSIFKEKEVRLSLLDSIFYIGTIGTGNYFAASWGAFAYAVSRKLLIKTEDHSQQSLINVFGKQPSFVWLLKDGIEVEVSFEALGVGDVVVVYAGETIPVDGTITSGTASVDQHTLTGESQPVEKEMGDKVLASTILLSGRILIEVEQAGAETVAAQIGDILTRTANFKSELQSWGEQVGDRSVLPTLTAGILTLPILGAAGALPIFNSCIGLYMRILAPLSMLTYLNLASQHGILIKDGRVLDALIEIDTVVFDKTGTLTLEQPHVGNIYTCRGISEDELLTYAAAAEYKQTHPIAKAILQSARERGLSIPEIEESKYEVGYGIKVNLVQEAGHNEVIRVGSARFMEMEQIAIPAEIQKIHHSGHEDGHSFVYIAAGNELYGTIELVPTIRPEAKQIISDLQQHNMSLYIISGDNEKPTRKLAQELGIKNYFAETLPENKAELIEQLQMAGKSVCFIGDGINDSIALKKANVSISLCGASTIATDTAQIVLMDQSLNQLIEVFDIAQRFKTNMRTNFAMTTLPGVMIVFGAFFLHFGIIPSLILNQLGLSIGVSNAVLPLVKHQKDKQDQRLTKNSRARSAHASPKLTLAQQPASREG